MTHKTLRVKALNGTSFVADLKLDPEILNHQMSASMAADAFGSYAESYRSRLQSETLEEIASSYCKADGTLAIPTDKLDTESYDHVHEFIQASIRDYQKVCQTYMIQKWEEADSHPAVLIGFPIVTGFLGTALAYAIEVRVRRDILKENCFHSALIKGSEDSGNKNGLTWVLLFLGSSSLFFALDSIINGDDHMFASAVIMGVPLSLTFALAKLLYDSQIKE